MPEIEIQFRSEGEYDRLRSIRDKYGVQWRGMLIQGAKLLEGRDLRFALTDRDDTPTSVNLRDTEPAHDPIARGDSTTTDPENGADGTPEDESSGEPEDDERIAGTGGSRWTFSDGTLFDDQGSLHTIGRSSAQFEVTESDGESNHTTGFGRRSGDR